MRSEWVERTIGEIAEVVGGGTPSTKDPSNFDGDIPWLTPKDLSRNHPRYVSRGARNLTRKGLETSSARLLPANSVLLTSRAPIGYVAIAANPIATNQGFRSLILKEEYDHEFVYYWLKAHKAELERHASGSTFKELSGSALKQIRIRLPLVKSEQRAIAHILGMLDDKIELNRRMNETLEAMARALFKSWFVDFDPVVVNAIKAGNPIPNKFAKRAAHYRQNPDALHLPEHFICLFPDRFVDSELGPIPEGWEVKTFRNMCLQPQYGYTASANERPVGPKFLRIKDINKTPWINWHEVPYCSISQRQKQKYLLRSGDLVIARIADPGHSALIEEQVEAVFASYLIRFRPADEVYDRYLQYWLRSDPYWQLVKRRQSGSTRGNLNARVLGAFPLVVPDPQVESQFRKTVEKIREQVVANVKEANTLASVRDTLLPKLISGELRVPDVERIVGDHL